MQNVINEIVKELNNNFDNATVKVNHITKNNGVELTGITITEGTVNIAPTIYVEPYVEKFGNDVDSIVAAICECYEHSKVTAPMDISCITNWSNAKEMVVPCLVNTKANARSLKDKWVHTDVLDLSVIYKIVVGSMSTEDSSAYVTVTYDLLKNFGISETELHETAMSNMPKPDYQDMGKIMMEMGMPPMPGMPIMNVLTNHSKTNGAVEILNDNLMQTIEDSYIIPSSIHEVIIVPEYSVDSADDLRQMICQVNVSELRPEEVLSDHPYHWSRETGLTMA